jgi:hypothetical protein
VVCTNGDPAPSRLWPTLQQPGQVRQLGVGWEAEAACTTARIQGWLCLPFWFFKPLPSSASDPPLLLKCSRLPTWYAGPLHWQNVLTFSLGSLPIVHRAAAQPLPFGVGICSGLSPPLVPWVIPGSYFVPPRNLHSTRPMSPSESPKSPSVQHRAAS